MELRALADFTLRPRLLIVPGVARVNVFGGDVRQLQVQVHPQALIAHGIALGDVVAAARDAIAVRGAGFVETANQRITLAAVGEPASAQALGETPIAARDGAALRLADVADVRGGARSQVRRRAGAGPARRAAHALEPVGRQHDGRDARARGGAGRARAAAGARGRDALPAAPPAGELHRIGARQRERRARDSGACSSSWCSCSSCATRERHSSRSRRFPSRLLSAVIILRQLGVTLNTMTLGGLAIAIGEVVDDAVVDVENIARRLRQNDALERPRSALAVVLDASLEVRSAIVFATASVVLVFLPLLTLGGIQGAFFAPLAQSYLLAILASLVVALTATPALSLLLLGRGSAHASRARHPDAAQGRLCTGARARHRTPGAALRGGGSRRGRRPGRAAVSRRRVRAGVSRAAPRAPGHGGARHRAARNAAHRSPHFGGAAGASARRHGRAAGGARGAGRGHLGPQPQRVPRRARADQRRRGGAHGRGRARPARGRARHRVGGADVPRRPHQRVDQRRDVGGGGESLRRRSRRARRQGGADRGDARRCAGSRGRPGGERRVVAADRDPPTAREAGASWPAAGRGSRSGPDRLPGCGGGTAPPRQPGDRRGRGRRPGEPAATRRRRPRCRSARRRERAFRSASSPRCARRAVATRSCTKAAAAARRSRATSRAATWRASSTRRNGRSPEQVSLPAGVYVVFGGTAQARARGAARHPAARRPRRLRHPAAARHGLAPPAQLRAARRQPPARARGRRARGVPLGKRPLARRAGRPGDTVRDHIPQRHHDALPLPTPGGGRGPALGVARRRCAAPASAWCPSR